MNRLIPLSACAALAAGCAVQPSPAALEQQRAIERSIPECVGEEDCRAKWEMAQIWVTRNAGFKIQVATPVLLETYNPSNYSPELAMRVTKEPQGGGRYRLRLEVWCANLFGCSTDPRAAILRFNTEIALAKP